LKSADTLEGKVKPSLWQVNCTLNHCDNLSPCNVSGKVKIAEGHFVPGKGGEILMNGVSVMKGVRELTSIREAGELIAGSENKPVFIFKHSTTCPVSFNALRDFEQFVKHTDRDQFDFALVVVREHRDVSNLIAEQLGVHHESPQVILVAGGKAVWDDSHYEITESKLKQVVMMYENGDLGD